MNGIILINKEKGITSRDAVNKLSKILGIKKIGHTGTLDPNATGLLVMCVGDATKLVEVLTNDEKEYIAEITLGILTETLDPEGEIIKKEEVLVTIEDVKESLIKLTGTYEQTVPIYSAIKINGKKLYEYARNNEQIELPKRKVTIKELELVSGLEDNTFSIRCVVSKGTYIRSLVRDIAEELGTIAIMSNLKRTRVGNYLLDDANNIEDNNYNVYSINDILTMYKKIKAEDYLVDMIKNGRILENRYDEDVIVFVDNTNQVLAIYKVYDKDKTKIKPWKMF